MAKKDPKESFMCLYGTREICLWKKGIYLSPLEECNPDCPIRQTTPKPQIKTKHLKKSNTVVI